MCITFAVKNLLLSLVDTAPATCNNNVVFEGKQDEQFKRLKHRYGGRVLREDLTVSRRKQSGNVCPCVTSSKFV